jgi:hypothetical protein
VNGELIHHGDTESTENAPTLGLALAVPIVLAFIRELRVLRVSVVKVVA